METAEEAHEWGHRNKDSQRPPGTFGAAGGPWPLVGQGLAGQFRLLGLASFLLVPKIMEAFSCRIQLACIIAGPP